MRSAGEKRFEGRVAMVTGGSDGLGLAIAMQLAAEGAQVVICGRRHEMLSAAENEIRQRGGLIESVQLDVADLDALADTIKTVGRKFQRLDAFVGNAYAAAFGPTVSMSVADWRRVFSVNVDAIFVGTSAALQIMYEQRSGSIVNVGSTACKNATPNLGAYAASKAALLHFSTTAAMEAADYGVRVNTLIPGSMRTSRHIARDKVQPELTRALAETIPLKREGTPDEVANAALFLLSDEASYITGAEIRVDGGAAPLKRIPTVTATRPGQL